jgi:hypothetical protein
LDQSYLFCLFFFLKTFTQCQAKWGGAIYNAQQGIQLEGVIFSLNSGNNGGNDAYDNNTLSNTYFSSSTVCCKIFADN